MTVDGPRGDEQRTATGIIPFLKSDLTTTAIYLIRLGTIYCGVGFLLGSFLSPSDPQFANTWYLRAHLAAAASCALRLHQRMKARDSSPTGSLRTVLMGEDAFHYLTFSVVFAMIAPVSVSVIPICLLALFNVAQFTKKLLDASTGPVNVATGDGPTTSSNLSQPSYIHKLLQTAVTKVNSNGLAILQWVALNEIMLIIVCIFVALTGPRIIILPFLYTFFIKMRYDSCRNPCTRRAFADLRMSLSLLTTNPRCPGFISRLISGLITLVTWIYSMLDR